MRTFGIERERFITDCDGTIIPAIGELLPYVHCVASEYGFSTDMFTFELFAGQIEDKTPPCSNFEEIRDALSLNDRVLIEASKRLGFLFDYSEFVDVKKVKSFQVNPFDQRHSTIWSSITNDMRIAASIVAGIHVHISVTCDEAVRILNSCRKEVIDQLIQIGDHSGLKRINSYLLMAGTNGVPPKFDDFTDLTKYIASKGGEKNVFDFVRYKPSTGTVEFRMFGATESLEEILGYVKACQDIVEG